MSEKFKGSRTEQHLINAFAGESQARMRYTFFAKVAKEEGYEQISEIFLQTAENEKEHSELFYEYIGTNPLGHVDGFYPFELGTTEENLTSAVAGELDEAEVLYKEAEEAAKEEGFDEIAHTFHHVRSVEEHHASRYNKLLETLKKGEIFQKDKEVSWLCRKCGYVHKGKSAPKACPNCKHPQAYFQLLCEKY